MLCFLCSLFVILLISDGGETYTKHQQSTYQNLYNDKRFTLAKMLIDTVPSALKFFREGDDLLSKEITDITPRYDQEYDFIVIGAGSAGATIASRLSEISDVTVLLIEAGRNENYLMDIPVLVNFFQFSDINWKYKTESSNRYCLGMTDQKCNYPRGKVMGGSSVINYMAATRGNRKDYDNWAEMGNEGWSYRDVLKYFKKLESIGIPELRRNKTLHNTNGPLNIDYPTFHTPLANAFLEAGLQMGYPIVDYNGEEDVGFSYLQATVKDGTRMSSNRAYLYPIHDRRNLFVSKFSHVNKILIDPTTKKAYGVEFTKWNRNIRVRARKEIILSAGAIGSPQLLMLSGVGPSSHLREMGIQVIQDAPVGENLIDHIAYGGLRFLVNQPVSVILADMVNPAKPHLYEYLQKRDGQMTIPGGLEALAFIDVDRPNDLNAWPNIELLFIGGSAISDPSLQYNLGISDEYWNKFFASQVGNHSWTIFPMLMHPKSRGRILLRSKDPKAHPKIYANYMDHPEDVRTMIKGVRAAISISKTDAMRKFNSTLYDAPVPGCELYEYDSDDYWECAIRTFTFTIYHQSGTCKMAPENDPSGVVNPRLQVKGIKGLRVADASVMPMITTGHINIPVIMIGEKLADMIKEDWNYIS